jgi:CARDB protein
MGRRARKGGPNDAQRVDLRLLLEEYLRKTGDTQMDLAQTSLVRSEEQRDGELYVSDRTISRMRDQADRDAVSWAKWDSLYEAMRERPRAIRAQDVLRSLGEILHPPPRTDISSPTGLASGGPDDVIREESENSPASARGVGRRTRVWIAAVAGASVLLFVAVIVRGWMLPARPVLSIDGQQSSARQQGENFTLVATGLTPCGNVIRWERPPHWARPGQEEMLLEDRADARGELHFSMMAGCEVTDQTYQWCVVDRTTGRRSNDVTAVVSSNVHCGPHLSDLEFTTVVLSTIEIKAGEHLQVRFGVRNAGREPAAASMTRLRLGAAAQRTKSSDPVLGDVAVPALAPGETMEVSAPVRIPENAASGKYFVWLVADNALANLEWKSQNNFIQSEPLTVTGVIPRPGCP